MLFQTFHLFRSVTVISPTCRIDTPNVSFPLGPVSSGEFAGIGASSAWNEQSLSVSGCSGQTRINMRVSGIADGDNPDLFEVTGGAAGIGVDLQTGTGMQVLPNDPIPIVWDTAAPSGSYNFKARYMQTKPVITPGQANAQMTVTLSYE